jgi:hypothetical protein
MFARSAFCDVTPRGREVRLAGYAARRDPARRILDPIEISAVLLQLGARRCLIVSFDLMIVGAELAEMIHARLDRRGYAPAEILLLASHTHSAPATDRACERLGVADPDIVAALADAVDGLVRRIEADEPQPVALTIRQGRLDHSINRRRRWPFPTFGRTYGLRLSSISMAPNPSGPRDERVTVMLLCRADDGQVLSILWHYACHPTSVVDNAVSADYPGAVRSALRSQFGAVACIFIPGFCGDVRPDITSSLRLGPAERVRGFARRLLSGPTFARCSPDDTARWRESLAAAVSAIMRGRAAPIPAVTELQVGMASIPLAAFFRGSAPAKPLLAQVVRLGKSLEIVALSAEACVGWEAILDRALPAPQGCIRLYAGYLGALFGYLPTRAQIAEGGYEVTGFQLLFGLSGTFLAERIDAAVIGCVSDAMAAPGPDALRTPVAARPSTGA